VSGFKGFENMYENQGNLSLGSGSLHVKNFATKSNLPSTQFYADGACFFQYAPANVNSTGAVKIMRVTDTAHVTAKYFDIRDLPLGEKAAHLTAAADEIAFRSPAMMQAEVNRGYFPYQIGYANDNSGTTKLIGKAADGFDAAYASLANGSNVGIDTGFYGVLDLQGWTDGAPPATKTSASFSAGEKWTAADFDAALVQ
jgi:hypothetical protein